MIGLMQDTEGSWRTERISKRESPFTNDGRR